MFFTHFRLPSGWYACGCCTPIYPRNLKCKQGRTYLEDFNWCLRNVMRDFSVSPLCAVMNYQALRATSVLRIILILLLFLLV